MNNEPKLREHPEHEVVNPIDFHLDPTCTHLYRRWWHKFVFWKKFKYAEDSYQNRVFTTLEKLKEKHE